MLRFSNIGCVLRFLSWVGLYSGGIRAVPYKRDDLGWLSKIESTLIILEYKLFCFWLSTLVSGAMTLLSSHHLLAFSAVHRRTPPTTTFLPRNKPTTTATKYSFRFPCSPVTPAVRLGVIHIRCLCQHPRSSAPQSRSHCRRSRRHLRAGFCF